MRVPPGILYAFIIVLCVVGAFGVRNNIADVYFCLAFGVLGYFMKRFGIPTAPFILAVILGPLAERYFLTSMASYDQGRVDILHPPHQRRHHGSRPRHAPLGQCGRPSFASCITRAA